MGRGRTLAQPPGQNPLTPPAPGSLTAPTAATSAAHGLSHSTPFASSTVSDQQAASAAAGNLGQQLLAQLQGQAAATPPPPGFDLGKGLLQQLQSRGTATSDNSNQASNPQQLPSGGTAPSHSQAASLDSTSQVSAAHTDADRAFAQQVQSRGNAPPESNSQGSNAQSNAGRAFLAQLQRSPAQMPKPVQSSATAGHNTRGSNPAAVSFEQLLRAAAANQQPRGQSQAQPVAQLSSGGARSASNMTFEQLLKAAAANPTAPLHSQSGPMHSHSGSMQSQPPPPLPGLTQPAAAIASNYATARSCPATAVAQHNPGRLFLQQLQQGGLQLNALPQQPSAPAAANSSSKSQQGVSSSQHVTADQAGKLLLQQLQRVSVSVSGASRAASRDPVGAVANAPQPEPSAPLAPSSVLLQNAAAAQHGMHSSHLLPQSQHVS